MDTILSWLATPSIGVDKTQGLLALAVLFGAVALRLLLVRVLRRLLGDPEREADQQRLRVKLERNLEAPLSAIVVLTGLYAAARLLGLGDLLPWVDRVYSTAMIALAGWLTMRAVDLALLVALKKRMVGSTLHKETLAKLMGRMAKAGIALFALVVILQDVYGLAVGGLLAGLGIGGLAVALAAQKSLSDLIGSVTLLVDRPFQVGDWIRSADGSVEGIVEKIGFRSTRVRTFEKTLLAVPNDAMSAMALDNVQARPDRRFLTTLRLRLDTPREALATALERIRQMLEDHPRVTRDQYLAARLAEIGPDAFHVTVCWFTTEKTWQLFMAMCEEINLKILEILDDEGVRLALPARDLHLSDRLVASQED